MLKQTKKQSRTKLSKHCLGTLFMEADDPLLRDGLACKNYVDSLLVYLGVKNLGDLLYPFPNSSFSLLINLAESHIAIHTWPEHDIVQLDVFLCNYQRDNSELCEQIFSNLVKYFQPVKVDSTIIKRR
jgi:S-adenosylmethionine decarboxylase